MSYNLFYILNKKIAGLLISKLHALKKTVNDLCFAYNYVGSLESKFDLIVVFYNINEPVIEKENVFCIQTNDFLSEIIKNFYEFKFEHKNLYAYDFTDFKDTINLYEFMMQYKIEQSKEDDIFIAITTYNRFTTFQKTIRAILKYNPSAKIFVFDDFSTNLNDVKRFCKFNSIKLYQNTFNGGIAYAKNWCLKEFLNSGKKHCFLFDDDCRPMKFGWEKQFINSNLQHSTYSWLKNKKNNIGQTILKTVNNIHYLTDCYGCLLFFNKDVVSGIGGMDFRYGKWGYEHGGLSYRIFNNGYTPHAFPITQNNLDNFIDSDDFNCIAISTSNDTIRSQSNKNLYNLEKTLSCWKPLGKFCFGLSITGIKNPQNPTVIWASNYKICEKWVNSLLKNFTRPVIFTNDKTIPEFFKNKVEAHFIEPLESENFWRYRWTHIYDHLKKHSSAYTNCEIWITDVSDVQMTRYPEIEKNCVYVGSEVTPNLGWFKNIKEGDNETYTKIQQSKNYFYNAGIIGGSYESLMPFLDDLEEMFKKVDESICFSSNNCTVDMYVLNKLLFNSNHTHNIVTGSLVHNKFKSFTDGKTNWFMHK